MAINEGLMSSKTTEVLFDISGLVLECGVEDDGEEYRVAREIVALFD